MVTRLGVHGFEDSSVMELAIRSASGEEPGAGGIVSGKT